MASKVEAPTSQVTGLARLTRQVVSDVLLAYGVHGSTVDRQIAEHNVLMSLEGFNEMAESHDCNCEHCSISRTRPRRKGRLDEHK